MSLRDGTNRLSPGEFFERFCAGDLARRLIELARDEDVGGGAGRGDVTTELWAPENDECAARLVAREDGVVCGLRCIGMIAEVFGTEITVTEAVANDGDWVRGGAEVAMLSGPKGGVLTVERTLLNIVGRLSGVATATRHLVRSVEGEAPGARARVLDTRKTTPGMRVLEKYAVRCGGGLTHRMGLHDAVLIKDNHLAGVALADLAGRVGALAERARRERPDLRFVEVEVDSLEQLERLCSLGRGVIDIVLLDNFGVDGLLEAVKMRDERAPDLLLEASGGVTEKTIGKIAATGVDRISTGSMTHSARWLDFGLDFEETS